MSHSEGGQNRYGSAGRTPLFGAMQRAMSLARLANQPGAPSVAELVERAARARRSRREFLKATAGSVGAAVLAGVAAPTRAPAAPPTVQQARRRPQIAVVGAGLAGLNAAYTLRKAGIRSTIYSAPERIGGRTISGHDLIGPGLTTEIGAEFIDTGHRDMLALAREFGLGLEDVFGPSEAGLAPAYYFDGRHFSEVEVIEAFRPVAARISADFRRVGGFPVTFLRKNPAAVRLDRTSLREYLQLIGATGPLFELLEVAYVTEFGLESDQQSCLNLIFLVATDVSEGFKIFGASDQRFKIQGGNDLVARGLADRLRDQIQVGHRLVAIRSRGRGFLLTFQTPTGPTREVAADVALLAIPFTLLREVDVQVDLPPYKQRAIRDLGYGANTKLFAGYNGRPWRSLGLTGDAFTDNTFMLSWDNSRPQPVPSGGLTLYLGGLPAVAAGAGTDAEQVQQYLPGVEQVFPGSSAQLNGRFGRAYWPGEPFIKASYAAYRPGQYTTIAGAEIRPVGNLFFAGEHCSLEFQGFMNGAANTGRTAAVSLVNQLRR
jgi:monoamine oxidase